ncbi:MAG: ABC transporter permease subunit, partial [Anabaena sp. CoA2_C59]|nr:ABC transporter permease subunit [Anabaena sp. CoA2_C59]
NYMNQIVQQYNLSLEPGKRISPVSPQVVFLYNPGLISSWFFVPGVMGLVLTLIGTLVSAVTVVREKDTGTLEQLLMTPTENWQILLSKIVPTLLSESVRHEKNFPLYVKNTSSTSAFYIITKI